MLRILGKQTSLFVIVMMLAVNVAALSAQDAVCDVSASESVAFIADIDGNYEIYTINLDGSCIQNLTSNPFDDLAPSWSPNGQILAFISTRSNPQGDVYIRTGEIDIRVTNNGATNIAPIAWSPDSRYFAFVSTQNHAQGDIFIYDVLNNSLSNITNDANPDFSPNWSSHGSEIVFVSGNSSASLMPYVFNFTTGERSRLLDSEEATWFPAWSPSGNYIGYFTISSSDGIYLFDTATANIEQLLVESSASPPMSWSPRNLEVAFAAGSVEGYRIYVVDLLNHLIAELPTRNRYAISPAWAPSGRYIAFFSQGQHARSSLCLFDYSTHQSVVLADQILVFSSEVDPFLLQSSPISWRAHPQPEHLIANSTDSFAIC
ncbi:MAG: PD40 domain-containing protein [Pleurocapsa minor GSE-CHR-MK-17-07R]|jgi:Tol biopolymer transport system component|nr:PD40 domain-containing protein [Pleurocapsa minor GSE-CHR-MK 17-07R]